MSVHDVIEQADDLRVRVVVDTNPVPPYDEGRSPMLKLHRGGWLGNWFVDYVTHLGGYQPAEMTSILVAANRIAGDKPQLFERWLRIFCGATAIEWYDSRDDGGDWLYVTFDTADWRTHHHLPHGRDSGVSLADWRAYCRGEVYGWVIERRAWTELDSIWGFFGHDEAADAAREALLYRLDLEGCADPEATS